MTHVDLRTPLRGLDICAGSGIGSWAFEQIGFGLDMRGLANQAFSLCDGVLQGL